MIYPNDQKQVFINNFTSVAFNKGVITGHKLGSSFIDLFYIVVICPLMRVPGAMSVF